MRLRQLHLLVTYRCVYECDHCFVWGGPSQEAAMTRAEVSRILQDAIELGTVEWIYFEGGEPFLYYPILLGGLREARSRGFRTGVVTSGAWATSPIAALAWLGPVAEIGLDDLAVSDDAFHAPDSGEAPASIAVRMAEEMSMPVSRLACARPGTETSGSTSELGKVMFRGRAAIELSKAIPLRPWESWNACSLENLKAPERVHIDPYGYVHVCQGLTMGSLWWNSLAEIVSSYDPENDPVIGPLLRGGPAGLVRESGIPHADAYADSCHLCYLARQALRDRYPERLGPDAMYGVRAPRENEA